MIRGMFQGPVSVSVLTVTCKSVPMIVAGFLRIDQGGDTWSSVADS